MEKNKKEPLTSVQFKIDAYEKKGFNDWQMHQIRLGLEDNLDVSIYAKTEFNQLQMWQIRLGLEKGLNVSIYAKQVFTDDKMGFIKHKLINSKSVTNLY